MADLPTLSGRDVVRVLRSLVRASGLTVDEFAGLAAR